MTNEPDMDEILERKAIEVEHWEPAVAQAAWEHYRDEMEKEKRNDER